MYKQSVTPISNPGHQQGVKIAARSIIERAELYPKIPSHDLCFDILWSEISDEPRGQPGQKFTVHFDKLHDLATEMFHIDGCHGRAAFDNVISENQTTSEDSISFTNHSVSSPETDATYHPE